MLKLAIFAVLVAAAAAEYWLLSSGGSEEGGGLYPSRRKDGVAAIGFILLGLVVVILLQQGQVESGCQPADCKYDVNGEACGYYQIHTGYYTDCGRPGSGWEACAKDKACADRCVIAYMNRYGTYCTGGRTPTCEDYARIHNGGPKGCVHSNTIGYWHKVQVYAG